jgi:hypothetical protein
MVENTSAFFMSYGSSRSVLGVVAIRVFQPNPFPSCRNRDLTTGQRFKLDCDFVDDILPIEADTELQALLRVPLGRVPEPA